METKILPFATMTVGGITYRLKITAQAAVEFEKKLNISIPRAWVRLDEMQIMAEILHAALKSYNSGISYEDALGLIDKYITEGHGIDELMDTIQEVYIVSGFMKRKPKDESAEAVSEKTEKTTES